MPDIGQGCCYQIAAGDAGYLVMGGLPGDAPPRFATSPNGVDWQTLDLVDWQGGSVGQLSSWAGRYLLAGVDGPADAPHAAFWTSDDGRAWEALPDSPALQFVAGSVTAANSKKGSIVMLDAAGDRITAVGEIWPDPCHEGCDGPIGVVEWKSMDGGLSWTRRKLAPEHQNHYPPVQVGDRWVRIAPYWDPLESSRDEKTWETAWSLPDGYYELSRVRLTSFGGVLVGFLGDYDGGLVVNSTDGETWVQSVGWPDLEKSEAINDVAGNVTTLVAIGFMYVGGTPKAHAFVSPPID